MPVLSVVKGIEEHTHARMSEVIANELPGRPVAVLSGPNLAREIAAGRPAGTVIASDDAALAAELASVLGNERFRVYTNPDVIGVELAGALKNVVALAAGMVDGLGFGDSAKAGIITRGLAEITRLGVAAGAHPGTFAGLAGVGDLIATCMSPLSRNRRAGELIASGVPWPEAQARLTGVAEGAFTVAGALELGAQHAVGAADRGAGPRGRLRGARAARGRRRAHVARDEGRALGLSEPSGYTRTGPAGCSAVG